MKSSLSKSVFLAATLFSTSVLSIAQGNIVYDNTTTDRGQAYFSNNQFGDDITLAGTDRTLSQFIFYYNFTGSSAGSAIGILRLYDNSPTPGISPPNNPLFTSDPITLSPGSNQQRIDFGGANPPVVVPDTFTWTIQFSGLGADQAGLLLYGPPTVGTTFGKFWENIGGTWTSQTIAGGSDFAARVTAVPEPSVLALGALAALIGAAKYRKLRQ